MNKITLSLLFLLFVSTVGLAQSKSIVSETSTLTRMTGTYLGTFQPEEADPELMPEFKILKNKVNKSANEEELIRYKDSLTKLKIAAGIINNQTSNKTTGSIDPIRVSGFNALTNQGTPSDNTLAVGNDGKMIAAVNSSFRVYNPNGSNVGTVKYFPLFWNSVISNNDMCDPLVFYDNNVDRYIIFTQLCDRVTSNNRILLAFSTSNDPAGSYHYYSFRSNLREILGPTNYQHDVWFDYPKMGISENDIFVTGNMFRNSGSNSHYVESAVFQIDKTACYAGSSTPAAVVYNALASSPFTLVPASDGLGGHYGDKMHLIATGSGLSSSTLKTYTISGKVSGSQTPTLTNRNVQIPSYSSPADGVQQGSNVVLNSGDKRGMSAMYVNGTVHFVFHCNGPSNYIAMNYNRLTENNGNWVVQNKLISFPGVDCAYPSIASMSYTPYEQAALIVFNYSTLTSYPGIRAVFIDHDIKISNALELNTGIGPVTFLVDNQGRTRWGDYTGISRKHNATIPTVWGFGMYGNTSGRWSNYITEIQTNAWVVNTEDVVSKNENDNIAVFPNPIADTWRLRLDIKKAGRMTVKVMDLSGQIVTDVFEAQVEEGTSEFSFNKNGLANGTYFVKVFIDETNIANEKIVVAK